MLTSPASSVIHDTSSSISQPKASFSNIPKTVTAFATTKAGKKFSLWEGLKILREIGYQTVLKGKKFDKGKFLEISLGIHQILSDDISAFVNEHKDAVLIGGAPGSLPFLLYFQSDLTAVICSVLVLFVRCL